MHILFITCTTAGITRYFKLQDLTVVLQGFFIAVNSNQPHIAIFLAYIGLYRECGLTSSRE